MDFIKRIPTHMDFEGQRKAERIFQIVILLHAVVGFVIGYSQQRFSYTVYAILFGFVVACLIVLPPWPYFRKNPLFWQKVIGGDSSATTTTTTTVSSHSPAGGKSGSSSGGKKKK